MNRLKELRTEKGMKQSELAEMLSIAQTAVSKYELGTLDIGTDTIRRLCDIFDCSADYLLGLSSVRSPEISEEEYALLAAYRRADQRARDMVDLALEPWAEKEKENTAAG